MAMTDAEFNDFEASCQDSLRTKQDRLAELYKLGTWPSFSYDGESGALTFVDAAGRVTVKARATVVGSFSTRGGGSWKWGWSNTSYPEARRRESEPLRALAEITGMEVFAMPGFEAPEETVASVVAIAVQHLDALGYYRAPSGSLSVFLAITSITMPGGVDA